MKADGLTLLDNTKVESIESENIGQAFPENPTDGMVWTLTDAEGNPQGNFVYGLGSWLPRANPDLTYNDVSFSTEGVIPSDEVITRYAVSKTSYLPKDFEFSVATLMVSGAVESGLVLKHIRNGVETKLADITFAGGQHLGTFVSAIAQDLLMVAGDVIVFESATVDADASDVCVTLSTYLA